jgi:hypothetical protein
MRSLVLLGCLTVSWAQNRIDSDWRSRIRALPDQPSASVGLNELREFESTVRLAAPYLTAPGPHNYEANRELVRRMWTYLAAVDIIARSPRASRRLGSAVGNARSTLFGLGLAYPYWMTAPPAQAEPPQLPAVKIGQPPFSLQAPALDQVPAAEQKEANELVDRYETTASRAAAAWQSADVLRQNLAARSMSLNARTTENVVRLQLYLELAAGDLRRRQWKSARENLEKVEYIATQVGNSVGR